MHPSAFISSIRFLFSVENTSFHFFNQIPILNWQNCYRRPDFPFLFLNLKQQAFPNPRLIFLMKIEDLLPNAHPYALVSLWNPA